MKRFLWLLLALLPGLAGADVHIAEWGVAETFDFKLYNADGTLDIDEVDGGTEVSLSCSEGTETTATNDFVDEGTSYSIALTAAELQCARVAVIVAATVTEVFFIETVGHPDAQVPCISGDCITSGTMQASTAGTAVLAASTNFADDYLNGAMIHIIAGTGAGQSRTITDWVQSSDTATINRNWNTTPDTTSKYRVVREDRAIITVTAGVVDANAVTIAADAIGSSQLAATGINEIRDGIMQYAMENGLTFEELVCHGSAILLGRSTFTAGSPDQAVFSDPTNTDIRVTVQYGADSGDRTSVVLSPTNCGSN